MKTPRIPYKAFTFSRTAGNTLVTEQSDLEAQRHFPRGQTPTHLYVVGLRETIPYQRASHLDVHSGGDVVARVYTPMPPYDGRRGVPQVHILND